MMILLPWFILSSGTPTFILSHCRHHRRRLLVDTRQITGESLLNFLYALLVAEELQSLKPYPNFIVMFFRYLTPSDYLTQCWFDIDGNFLKNQVFAFNICSKAHEIQLLLVSRNFVHSLYPTQRKIIPTVIHLHLSVFLSNNRDCKCGWPFTASEIGRSLHLVAVTWKYKKPI